MTFVYNLCNLQFNFKKEVWGKEKIQRKVEQFLEIGREIRKICWNYSTHVAQFWLIHCRKVNESVAECRRKLPRKSLGEMVILHGRTRCENRERRETSPSLRLVLHCIQFGTLNTTFGRHFRRHWIPSVYCHELSSIMPWPTYVWLRESVTHLYKKRRWLLVWLLSPPIQLVAF